MFRYDRARVRQHAIAARKHSLQVLLRTGGSRVLFGTSDSVRHTHITEAAHTRRARWTTVSVSFEAHC